MRAATAMSAAPTGANAIFAALLDEVIKAQRALTKCLIKRDADLRETCLGLRTNAITALSAWVDTLDAARRQQTARAKRLQREVEQARLVMGILSESVPMLVAEAEARTTAVVRIHESRLPAYRRVIEQLVEAGYAKRVNGDVVITFAGFLELSQAQKTRDALDELRTEHFQTERKLHELEQRTNTSALQGAGA